MVDILVRDVVRDADQWDHLADTAAVQSPFLRSWWLDAWSGPEAQIVHVVDGSELIGGLAVRSTSRLGIEQVHLLGDELAPDHCDFIAAPGSESIVRDSIAAWLNRPGQRRITLTGVAERAALLEALPSTAKSAVVDTAPYHRLPKEFETYLSSRKPMFRKNIRRYRRQTVERGLHHQVLSATDVDFGLAELRRLHWLSFGEESSFLAHFDQFETAARKGIAKGEVLLHAILDGDRAVAMEAVFEVGGRISTFQSGRDTSNPRASHVGNVLMSLAIEHAIERGCRELDMLRGGQDYKRAWADQTRHLLVTQATAGVAAGALQRSLDSLRRIKRACVAHGSQSVQRLRSTCRRSSAVDDAPPASKVG